MIKVKGAIAIARCSTATALNTESDAYVLLQSARHV